MSHFKHTVLLAASMLVLAGCAQGAARPADTAADEAAVREAGAAWFTAYSAGDAEGVAALYADDAVVNPPGSPPARGSAAIREAVAKDIANSSGGGFSLKPGSESEIGVSGDLAWEWNTFTVQDKSGATVDAGKYVTLFQRRDGKWLIIRDIWNSDNPPPQPS